MSLKGINTYSCWVEEIGLLCNKTISKQALFDRLSSKAVEFIRKLLEDRLSKSYQRERMEGLFSTFKNVFLHDSTTLQLPNSLVKFFPGNITMGLQKAIARIQAIYSFKQGMFVCFKLTAYVCNDQGASSLIIPYINKGDLVIRDLGFFVLNTLDQIAKQGSYFLSKMRYGVSIYTLGGQRVDLKKLLKKKKALDIEVLIGEKQRLKVRLVVRKVPTQIAEQRRRKAKKDRDKRLNHSGAYYFLLGYSIYITNVSEEVWSAEEVESAYKVRWQIEVFFKSWKSHFNIQQLIHNQCQRKVRVECIIYLVLLFITLFQTVLYSYYRKRIWKKYEKHISLLKLANFVANHFGMLLLKRIKDLEKYILKYCCYESRTDRVNAMQAYYNYHN